MKSYQASFSSTMLWDKKSTTTKICKKTHTHTHTQAKQTTNGHWRTQKRNLKISGHKWKNNNPKSMGCGKSSFKRVVYSNTSLPQETRKISSNLTSHLKELEKEKQNQKLVEGKKS